MISGELKLKVFTIFSSSIRDLFGYGKHGGTVYSNKDDSYKTRAFYLDYLSIGLSFFLGNCK